MSIVSLMRVNNTCPEDLKTAIKNSLNLIKHDYKKNVRRIVINILIIRNDFIFNNKLSVGIIDGKAEPSLYFSDNYIDNKPIFIRKSIGNGKLYVFGGILNFSNRNFGHSGFIPQGEKTLINELILQIYKIVLIE